jgi:uncharacterized repeat protein (TIGR01451 family)
MRKLFLTIAILLFVAVIATPPAMAVGTAVSTTISNQAYGDYKDANGNNMARAYSNTVTITVAQVYAVRLNPTSAGSSGGNDLPVFYSSRLYNDGNGPDTQTFTLTSTGGTWAPTSYTVYRDVNDNGAYDAGTDTVITPSGGNYLTASIAADGYFPIIVAVLVPDNATAPNGTNNQSTLTTTSNGDPTKTTSSVATTTVLAAVIASTKTHTSPGGTHKPGDVVTWTVMMSNSGSAAATAISAIDVIPTNVTFVPGSIEVNFNDTGWVSRNDACGDGPDTCYDAANHRILIPGDSNPSPYDLPAGANYKIRIRVTINTGVPWNTTISNYAQTTYTSGADTLTVNSNTDSFVVDQLAGITMTKISTNQSGDPSDVITYRFDVTNAGNKTDSFDLTTNSSNAWTWVYWVDTDNNGTGDTLLTDTNGNGTVDTGNILQAGVIHLVAIATIPAGRSNGTTDTLTATGTSYFDVTKTANVQWTTTVTAPVLAIAKQLVLVVHPAGVLNYSESPCTPTNKSTGAGCSYYPGSVVTYQITATNNGAGNLTNLILTDPVPANTTYKTGTIRSGTSVGTLAARTDTADGDGGRYEGGAVISGAGSTIDLGPGATWVVEFQTTIN